MPTAVLRSSAQKPRRTSSLSSRLIAGPAAVAVALLGVVAIAPAASAVEPAKVVNPASSDWSGAAPLADTRPGGSFGFTTQYGAPTGLGTGALKLATTDVPAKVQYFTANEAGVPLADINGVSYSSYKSSESTGLQLQIPTVNLYMDLDGVLGNPVTFAPLIFEPYYTYGVTPSDVWQSWDGSNPAALYWSTKQIGNIAPASYRPLADYKAQAPNAIVTTSGFNLGSGNAGIVGAVDGLTIDRITGTDKTYDFEPLDGIVVDDDGAGVAGNCDDPTPAFGTIQAAVNFASAGGTVNVCAGSYTENITVGKQLTLLGAQAGNDARVGRTNTAAESVVHGYLNASGTSGTTIDGFWFTDNTATPSSISFASGSGHRVVNTVIADNTAPSVQHAIYYNILGGGTTPSVFSRNRITNNYLHGIFGTTAVNVTISDNAFAGNGSSVVHFAPAPGSGSGGVVVSGNTSTGDDNFIVGSGVNGLTVSGNTVTGTVGTGMLFGGEFANVTLTNNTITNSGGSGVAMTNDFGAANSAFTFTSNTFTGNARGISFASGGYTGTAQVHFNRIVGNTTEADGRVGIRNLSGGAINAEDNWFGCNEGTGFTDCDRDVGTVDSTPNLVLGLTVSPNPVTGPAAVTADLTRNSAGVDRSSAGTLPATPVTFATTKGTLTSATATTVNGKAATTLLPGSATGSGSVSATVDFETVSTAVTFATPRLNIADVSVVEGAGTAAFTVSLTFPTDDPVTFSYATTGGTAVPGADFTATSGTATIAPGATTTTVSVPISSDALDEDDETFTVTLSGGSVPITDSSATGTIVDDDNAPQVFITDAGNVIEGTQATFVVTLSGPSGRTTSVKLLTRDSTAKAPRDYDPASNMLITFAPGEVAQTVRISVKLDLKIEGNEIFGAGIYKPTFLKIGDRAGQATIVANAT